MTDNPKAIGDKREVRDPETGKFKPGNATGGRSKGSRNKLGEAFLAALHDDFKENGVQAIEKVRTDKPDAYLKVIASILPKELNIKVEDELSDTELDERIRQLAAALSLEIGASGVAGDQGEAEGAEQAKDLSALH